MDAPVLRSGADPADPAFQRYRKEHGELVADLRDRIATAGLGGPERARARHVERGKLLPARPRRRAGRPVVAVPGAVAAGRRTACTTARPPAPG